MRAALLIITFDAAILAGIMMLRRRPGPHIWSRRMLALVAVFVVTASLSALQFPFPGILAALRRNRGRLLEGQVWRLVTPLFVQDGGTIGTISNLTLFVLLGGLAILLLGWRRWLLLYFVTGIASEMVAYAWLRQGFAGNSIANMGVAAGLIVLALQVKQRPALVMSGIGLVAGVLLLAARDLHGAAFVIGLVFAAIITLWQQRRAELKR